ncbi:MAG: methyltransferase [Desulfurococcaceae archaeon]
MPLCISIERTLAERAIKELRRRGILDREHLITRAGNSVIVPVRVNAPGELELSFTRLPVFECSPPLREIVKAPLPSLDVVGNVVILRENVLKLRRAEDIIAAIKQVYPRVKAVWVKEETNDVFRIPLLKLLWGEEVREITVKEYGIEMRVKLGEVYFNPRLAEEHRSVAQLTKNGEVVVDVFSGIGGFTLHIASMRRCLVVANDLNPVAYELLVENIKLNRRKLKSTIIPLNSDAVELPHILRQGVADRLIADFPMKSTEYYEVYEKLLKPRGILHLYTVSTCSPEYARAKLAGVFENWHIVQCKPVLEYAPRTEIYRCDLVKPDNV